jgi:hypothetical protein
MRRSLALVLALVVVMTAPSALAQGEQPAELTLGDWQGFAFASGFTWAAEADILVTWVATIESEYEFTVTDGGIEGEFDLESSGVQGNYEMKMSGVTPDGQMNASFNIDDPAGGTISGARSELQFESTTVTTSGTLSMDIYGSKTDLPIRGAPSTVSITNTITHLTCDMAVGNWDVSITQQIQDQGWTPEWQGHWVAVLIPPPGQETAQEELIDDLSELTKDFDDYRISLGRAVGPDPNFDPTAIRSAELVPLVNRATAIANRLHNLSPCDAAAIGSETLQKWRTALADMVGDLVLTAGEAVAAQNKFPGFDSLIALVQAADTTGSYGAGSPLGAGQASEIEAALIDLTSRSIEGHLNNSTGNDDHYRWAAGGVATAVSHGWPVTVGGTTYAPADAPSLVASPPGGDE